MNLSVPAEPFDAIVVGAGAAGLVAGAELAERGLRTLLLEKNKHAGVKILMSGGTRCNLTQDTDSRGIVAGFGPNGPFLHSALAAFGVDDALNMFATEGLMTYVEPGGKIFPASDKARDVLNALLARLTRSGCTLALEESLQEVARDETGFVLRTSKRALTTPALLITTGGLSYPGSGTTGDGYQFARALGHTIVPPRPALVPITTDAQWVRDLRGITVPDAHLRVIEPSAEGRKPKVLSERRASLLFAHFGLTGPAALDVSQAVSGHPNPRSLVLECDFLPATSRGELEESLRNAAAENGKRQLVSLLPDLLPRRLCEACLQHLGLDPALKAAELSAKNLALTVMAIKAQPIPVSGTRGFGKAEVTAGGVSLAEVDSRTMQSKLVPGLHFAGEVLDLDGRIGGYNFQGAWSTGFLAARSIAERA